MANIAKFEKEREALELACNMAANTQIKANAASFFAAAEIVQKIDEALSPAVIEQVAMPLMNRRCGFLTDKREGGYSVDIVRDAIIDAITYGLLPVGNQFNIIGGKMYVTKEGFSYLLAKTGVKYMPLIGSPKSKDQDTIVFPCKVTFKENAADPEYKNFGIDISVPIKNGNNPIDLLRGKAERRLKKEFYGYLTGIYLGDADEDSGKDNYNVNPPSVQPTDENKAKAAAVFGGGKQAEDAQVVGEQKKPLTEEERKAAYQAELAKAKAGMGIKS